MSDYIDKYANRLMSEEVSEHMKSIINARSIGCALVVLIPFPALDDIIYTILLWTMYGKISRAAGVPFREHFISNTLNGIIVNLLVVFVDSVVLEPLILAGGWIGSLLFAFFATKISGHSYVNQLKVFHGNKVANHPNVRLASKPTNNRQQISPQYGNQALPNASEYFLSSNGHQTGPFKIQELQQMAANGQVTASMLVWKQGSASWVAANRLPELANLFNVTPCQNALPPQQYNAVHQAYNPDTQNALPNNKLLTCPDCGQKVSRRADACPNCGCPISEMNQ